MTTGDNSAALRAAADQGHAAAEELLDRMIRWWTQEARPRYADAITCRADEVSVLTHVLTVSGTTGYSALLATALCRLTDRGSDDEFGK
jgi:hypothetical protein